MIGLDEIHVLHTTGTTLNQRFSILQSMKVEVPLRPKQFLGNAMANSSLKNKRLIEQIARRMDMQSNRRPLRQRIGLQGARGRGFGALRQAGIKSRLAFAGSTSNLSRSGSFGNLSQASFGNNQRGFRRKPPIGALRGGTFSRGAQRGVNVNGQRRGMARGRGVTPGVRGRGAKGAGRGAMDAGRGAVGAARGAVQGARGAVGRGRGGQRGRGLMRNQSQKLVPTKEELDAQLDQYMSNTRSALDKELEVYMNSAMDLDGSYL